MHEKRKNICRKKIKEYFAQISDLVHDCELKTLADLERQSKIEESRLKKVFEEIDHIKRNIKNDLSVVENLINSGGEEKVACFDLIDKIK